MKNDDIKNKLDLLESKLDLLLLPADRPAPYTLHGWLETWYSTYKPPTLSHKWLAVLRNNIDRIKRLTVDKPLNEYTPAELLKAIYVVPLNYTRSACYNLLNAAYNQAVRLGYVRFNPLSETPKIKHVRQVGRALTLDEQRRFIEALAGNPRKPLYMFYLLSGCRRAEALSLSWADIDENARLIHIHGTKTPRANRHIPLFPQICAVLANLPRDCVNIFPYTCDSIEGHFRRFKRKFGFNFRLHDLRHTFATRCLESGISIFTVSKWLGHTSTVTTSNIYAHLLTDFERQEIERFDPKI